MENALSKSWDDALDQVKMGAINSPWAIHFNAVRAMDEILKSHHHAAYYLERFGV